MARLHQPSPSSREFYATIVGGGMKQLIILVTGLLLGCLPALGGTDPSAQQLLISAKQQANLYRDQASPFELDVAFIAQINVPVQGHLTLKSEAKDRWWRKVAMGNFEQIEIRDGDRLYTSRNTEFTPVRVVELVRMLQFAEGSEGLSVKKQKRRLDGGIEMSCLTAERENSKNWPHEICVNLATHEILSDDWQQPPDERRSEVYSDYFDFGPHRYPRKLELRVNGVKLITANVDSLTVAPFDDTLLVPPKGALERRQCDDMKQATPLKTPDPMYPTSARQNRMMGNTEVAMTVLTDGSVTDIHLVGSATRSLDDATMQTLKGWKFKPAMCGTEPVVSDIHVTVSFRLH